jgi:hypothetical protein
VLVTINDLREELVRIAADADLYPTIARHRAGCLIREWALEESLQNALYKLPKELLDIYESLPVSKR